MSTPWTRVPKTAPPLDPTQLRLLPVADAFMALMLSRPGGLSLRTTWVTPASIWLCSAVAVLLGPLGIGVIGYAVSMRHVLLIVAGMVATALATGAAMVAIFGIRQRSLSRSATPAQPSS